MRAYIKKTIRLYDAVANKLSEAKQGSFYISREKLGLLYADTATVESILAYDDIFAPLYNKLVFSKKYRRRSRKIY